MRSIGLNERDDCHGIGRTLTERIGSVKVGRMRAERTPAQRRAIAALLRFYRVDHLMRRRPVAHVRDFEALQRAARKVVRTEAEAPELGRDMNPFIMMIRSELQQSA